MSYRALFGTRLTRASATLAVASLAACSGVTDSLLESDDPDIIPPPAVESPAGAIAIANGALARFRDATAGGVSTWLFGGLLADEWSTSSTFVQNDETDQRSIQENNGSVTGQFRTLNRVRTGANQAIALLTKWIPTNTALKAEMYFARGFAEMQLAQDFCNGIPLSDGSGDELILGDPLPVADVFRRAMASLDTSIAITGTSTAAADVNIRNAARITKARAQLGIADFTAAASTLTPTIATSYAYAHTFATTTGDNVIWSQNPSNGRFTVGDSLEGNGRNIVVRNAIPFTTARDPRLPVTDTRTASRPTVGQDGQTSLKITNIYARSTSIDIVNGLDARLVEAEVALKANNVTQWLSILNALRAAPPKIGEHQPAVMTALTDPGATLTGPAATDTRVSLHFREKAFWTFSRGQRLGDLRRLIRQYGRTPDNTFPTGVHYKGGNYGRDVNLPVVTDERNNPAFKGCTNRDA
ncbi:MAG: hypothetical protein ACT4P6_21135 [Gemmatimonadaceae bacterium]